MASRNSCHSFCIERIQAKSDDVTCITWSVDSSVIMAGSRDSTARIWTVNTTQNYQPVTLSGHKTSLVGAYFSQGSSDTKISSCYTISQDGALVTWECNYNDAEEESTIAARIQGGQCRPFL